VNAEEKIPAAASMNPDSGLRPMATVMATSIFATTFVQLQSLGYLPFNHLLMTSMGLDSNRAATFMSLAMLPWSFKAIAGLLVDGVPLFGSRRRNYLLLSALAAAVMWLLMGFYPGNYNLLLALVLAMNVAIVLGSATAGGLQVEAGQKFGMSGRLSSLRVFAQTSGNGLGLWLGGLLAGYALGWTSAVAILAMACMFLCAWLLLREPAAALPAGGGDFPGKSIVKVVLNIWAQIKNVLRREMLLPAALVFFIQAVPTFRSTSLYEYQTKTLNYSDASLGLLQFVGCGVSLLSTVIYAWWCRKASLRASLYGAIFMTSLSALPYLFYGPYTPYMPRAMAIESIGTFFVYFAYLPLFDLMVRSTPKGSEALGFSLLISVWNIGLMIGTKTGPMLYDRVFNKNIHDVIWLNAGVTLAGMVIVFLLPGKLVAGREGAR